MTPELDTAIRQALAGKVIKPCEGCGHHQWDIVELVAAPVINIAPAVVYRDGSPASSIPMLLLACANCGLFRHYSAVRLGLIQPAVK